MKHVFTFLGAAMMMSCSSGSGSEDPSTEDPGSVQPLPSAPAPEVGTGARAPGGGTVTQPPTGGAGTTPPPAGGGGTTPPPGSPAGTAAFAGAPAYVATLGPSTIDTTGKGQGHLSFNAQGNPAGRACLDCHDGDGKGAPAFLFAGTVYDPTGKVVVPKAEVRMLGADGKGISAYTDANGNFFFRVGSGTTTAPAIAGARSATTVRSMTNKINDGNCNQCHGTSARLAL